MAANEYLTTSRETATPAPWDVVFSTTMMEQPSASRDEVELRPDVIERLEALDDVIFAAIDGDPAALDVAADTWCSTLCELGLETVEASRQQYLRRAQNVWDTLREQPNHSPAESFAAIEIMSLLGD